MMCGDGEGGTVVREGGDSGDGEGGTVVMGRGDKW